MRKLIYVLFTLVFMSVILFIITTNSIFSNTNSTEQSLPIINTYGINYKLLDHKGASAVYSFTDSDDITLYLHITPTLNKEIPVLYTIFMNGVQIQPIWNDTTHSCLYNYIIKPNKKDVIKITIKNIPNGINTFQFGTVYFPNKIFWEDENVIFSDNYSLRLEPFTVVSKENILNINLLNFKYNEKLIKRDYTNVVDMYGILSISQDFISFNSFYDIRDVNKIYYHWKNTDRQERNVRFSILKDWKQIPWPNIDEYFIDILVYPNDAIIKELDFSYLITDEDDTVQFTIVSFVDPGISFWYYDGNDLKANHYGSQGFASMRTILKREVNL